MLLEGLLSFALALEWSQGALLPRLDHVAAARRPGGGGGRCMLLKTSPEFPEGHNQLEKGGARHNGPASAASRTTASDAARERRTIIRRQNQLTDRACVRVPCRCDASQIVTEIKVKTTEAFEIESDSERQRPRQRRAHRPPCSRLSTADDTCI